MSEQKQPHERFLELEKELKKKCPAAIEKAEELAESVVDSNEADADEIWRVLWDKPLFSSGAYASTVEGWVRKMEPQMLGAWKDLGTDRYRSQFYIEQNGTRFRVEGEVANDILDRTGMDCPKGKGGYRLFSIQRTAVALRKRVEKRGCEKPFSGTLDVMDGENYEENLLQVVESLQNELGHGWGPVATPHALTDMGLAVKPDRHVVRTARALGLCDGLPDDDGNLTVEDKMRIVARVRDMVAKMYQPATAQEMGKKLRYTDKVMMDISRCRLLDG